MRTQQLQALTQQRLQTITLQRKWAHGRWLKLNSKVYDAAGATEREVVEALEVAIEMGVVPATVHARFALGVMDSLFEKGKP